MVPPSHLLSRFFSTIISLYQSGLISRQTALEELRAQGRELGMFTGLEGLGEASAADL